ncbi:MAG: YfiR family protein [Candidatus Omnitrophica bacterium]|nr:YfiR family protein [Candidatus Omnitrophota bacterium]
MLKLFSFVLFTLVLVHSGMAPAQKFEEYEIKSEFIYKIIKYVDWPGNGPLSASPEFTIGILGDNPFEDKIENTIADRPLHDKPVRVMKFPSLKDFRPCHVLFVCHSQMRNLPEILDLCERSCTLTIADTPRFAHRGGILNLVKEANHIHFEINLEAAEKSHLVLDLRLVKLGRVIQR